MVRLGRSHGIETTALVSPMDEPLGHAVGNALEVDEARAVLRGEGPDDVRGLALEAAAVLVGDRCRAERALDTGEAFEAFRRWVGAQGGHPDAPLDPAPVVVEAPAPRAATVRRCHAYRVGELAMELGAGRRVKGAGIDHAVGVVVHRKAGDAVEAGEPLATVHAREPFDPARAVACFSFEGDA